MILFNLLMLFSIRGAAETSISAKNSSTSSPSLPAWLTPGTVDVLTNLYGKYGVGWSICWNRAGSILFG
jgi:hypothetical protein